MQIFKQVRSNYFKNLSSSSSFFSIKVDSCFIYAPQVLRFQVLTNTNMKKEKCLVWAQLSSARLGWTSKSLLKVSESSFLHASPKLGNTWQISTAIAATAWFYVIIHFICFCIWNAIWFEIFQSTTAELEYFNFEHLAKLFSRTNREMLFRICWTDIDSRLQVE